MSGIDKYQGAALAVSTSDRGDGIFYLAIHTVARDQPEPRENTEPNMARR